MTNSENDAGQLGPLGHLAALAKDIDDDLSIITLVRGQRPDGTDFHAYALIPPGRYDAFLAAQAKGSYDLAAFGKIVHLGAGQNPPPAIRKLIEETYGADHAFTQKLTQIMAQYKDAREQAQDDDQDKGDQTS